ncbi:hypothetical protein PPERSA_03087 [Pseudocohnilembus persalinus]|uniref:Uncharacterized protein n=1 Tax=Pseudocohnilembus persalinus TaxID=266149 RepID=A0A0V0QL75_PSEPJ|nr:hypothetical protein PPERSA_03087 [Pseudocohnilembus persalinus]|eukprot:KRX02996.1 hypothetical protein PPERSA_03087 [Pseudocohnilembus persalinus]
MATASTFNKQSTVKQQAGDFLDLQQKRPSEVAMMNEIKRLKSEVGFLNNINTRLGKELVKCQNRLGVDPGKEPLMGEFNEMKQNQQIYNQKTGTFSQQEISFLEPLFLAYDEKLEQMESLTQNVYEDIKSMERKSEELIEENTYLRKELEEKCEEMLKLHKNGTGEGDIQYTFQKLDYEDLKERLYLMTQENQELLEKFKEISNNYNYMKITKENNVKELQECELQLQQSEKEKKDMMIKLDKANSQIEILENKLNNYGEKIVNTETEQSDLQAKYQRSLNEIKLLKTQVQNLKKQNLDIEEKRGQEISILSKDYEALKLKEREGFNKIIFMEREMDQSKEEIRKIRKDLDQKQSDCEQMIRMMENYESKIQLFQKKEDQLSKLAREQKEQVQQAFLEKDKSLLKQEQLEKSLENLTQKNREEFEAQKEQYEKIMNNIRQKNKQQIEERDEELKELQEQYVQLQLKMDKQNKDYLSLQQENQKLNQFLKEDISGQHDQQLSDYQRRINELEEKLQIKEQFNNDRIHELSIDKQQLESQYKNLQNIHSDVKSNLEDVREKYSQVNSEFQTVKSRLNAAVREKQAVLDEISKIKKHYESKLEYSQEEYNSKLRDLQEQNQVSLQREKSSRQKAIELLQNHDRMEEKMKFEYESRIKELEQYVLQMKSQLKTTNDKLNRATNEKAARQYN